MFRNETGCNAGFTKIASGGSATVGTVIQELAWLSPSSSWDFTLDEIAFYFATPPAGPVGPNPNP